ncbi:MAG: hypothetical protein AB8B55_14065 [Mariniblastus sp.]
MARMFSGFVSILLLFVCLPISGSTVAAQTAVSSRSAIPKLDLPTSGQPFYSLIEDAIVKTPVENPAPSLVADAGVRTCRLNAPCSGMCQSKCSGSCRSGIVCSDQECEDACKSVDETVAGLLDPADEYCDQMAGLLANTLGGSNMPESKVKAIKEAMKMVAAKAREEANNKTEKLHAEYQTAMQQMQANMNHMANVSDSNENFRAWLHPIYTNQTKAFEQLRSIAKSKMMITQRLEIIDARLAAMSGNSENGKAQSQRLPTQLQTPQDFGTNLTRTFDANSNRVGNEPLAYGRSTIVESELLRDELQQLQARIKRLQSGQLSPGSSTGIRKASYLEPIYSPDQVRQQKLQQRSQRLQPIDNDNRPSRLIWSR